MSNVVRIEKNKHEGWELLLSRNKEDRVRKTVANLETIFTHHPAWRGLLVKDSFAERILAVADDDDGRTPPDIEPGNWSDVATTRARVWLSTTYGIEADSGMVDAVVDSIAERQQRHPVREYLKSLRWDGTQRLPKMLTTYFGTADNSYFASIATMWMISGVARVFHPGCQADYMLVLIGSQGTRKSSAIRVLAKSWPADSIINLERNDAMQGLRGVWIYEIAELAAIKAARDIERVKAFVTSRIDHYRPPYGRRFVDIPRQCIFAGTTNDDTPLHDTENRRFWTVDCGEINLDSLKRDVDQLWAEALVRYEMKEPHHPDTPEVAALCRDEQSLHSKSDPWQPIVERWLQRSNVHFEITPGNWARFDEGMTTTDALQGAIGISKERIDHYASSRMGKILRDLGFEAQRVGRDRTRKYYPRHRALTIANIEQIQEELFP